MPESQSHKRTKKRLAGPKGKTEVKLRSGRRMDALTKNRIGAEVERQGPKGISKAVSRLKEAKSTKVALGAKIAVPQKDMRQAGSEMRKQRLSGRVENLSNTKSYYVKASQSKSKRTYSRRSTKR